MKQYLNDLKTISHCGESRRTRSGEVISIFGLQTRYDLNAGFPAVTTKKLAWKSVKAELLWFLEGSGDERRLCEIMHGTRDTDKRTIWTDNADAQGIDCGFINTESSKDLGPIYGPNWRFIESNEYFPVKRRIYINEPYILSEPRQKCFGNNKYIGNTYKNKFGQEYIVYSLGNKMSNGKESFQNTFNIQYTTTSAIYKNLKKVGNLNSHRDGFEHSVYGVGKLGYYKNKKESYINKRLRSVWEGMISRCYNINDKSYDRNIKNNITVCDRWHVLSNFIKDAKLLPGYAWFLKYKKNVVIDKDYYGKNSYSPNTSIFSLQYFNKQYRDDAISIIYNDKYYPSIRSCSKKINLSEVKIKNKLKSNKDFKEYKNTEFVIRHAHPVDQITNVIEGIKKDPFGRRHIVSAWNPATVDYGALPPCHDFIQFYVSNNYKLSCQMYQRSADMFLGVPFNIASYALLTHMVAHVCQLDIGEFIHSIGDAHIYKNHEMQVKQQLAREPHPSPTLWLNPKIDNIFDFKMSDIDWDMPYTSHDSISAPMAV